jgi:predicted NACHT family NTPase
MEDKKDKQQTTKDEKQIGLSKLLNATLGGNSSLTAEQLNAAIASSEKADDTDSQNSNKKAERNAGPAADSDENDPEAGMMEWLKKNLSVPKEISSARYKICKECEHLRPKTRTCNICNCFMPGKVHIGTSSCPEGKWGRAIKV